MKQMMAPKGIGCKRMLGSVGENKKEGRMEKVNRA
jgi:hypothetical protein